MFGDDFDWTGEYVDPFGGLEDFDWSPSNFDVGGGFDDAGGFYAGGANLRWPSGGADPNASFGLSSLADFDTAPGDQFDLPQIPDVAGPVDMPQPTGGFDPFQMPGQPSGDPMNVTTAAPVDPEAAPGQSAISKAIEGATAVGGKVMDAGGRLVDRAAADPLRAALGLGALASVGGGLFGSSKTKLSSQEKAAMAAMAQARQQASGTPTQRGYGGEEAIRERYNEQVLAALEGNEELASPATVRRLEDQRQLVRNRLRQELGPGWETSTAGSNALQNFEERAAAELAAEREAILSGRSSQALARTGVARQLETDPFNLARLELATVGPIESAGRETAAAGRRGLISLGGQLAGVTAAPWLYDDLRRRAAGAA